jgi:FOG: Ankyrin repeat
VNQEGPDRVTPLLKAVERGHANIVKLLLQRGANVHSYIESTGTVIRK